MAIDARNDSALRSRLNIDVQNIKLAQLFPDKPNLAKGLGQQRLGEVRNLIAGRREDLTPLLGRLGRLEAASRDFK